MGSLTRPGHLWAVLSVTAAALCCSGFYLPFWIQGRILGRVDAYFNSFRRCNYPRVGPQGTVEIVMQCARYSRWRDIPSGWWQASTVLVGLGCGLAIIVAVMAVAACCVDHVVHEATARLVGATQLLSEDRLDWHYSLYTLIPRLGLRLPATGLCCPLVKPFLTQLFQPGVLVSAGLAVYPLGWDNREMRDSCGASAHLYVLGNCKISWALYMITASVLTLLLCFTLSPSISKSNIYYYRT